MYILLSAFGYECCASCVPCKVESIIICSFSRVYPNNVNEPAKNLCVCAGRFYVKIQNKRNAKFNRIPDILIWISCTRSLILFSLVLMLIAIEI